MIDCLIAGKLPMGSACAPPSGSVMMSSITPNWTSSWAVMRRASVACRWRTSHRSATFVTDDAPSGRSPDSPDFSCCRVFTSQIEPVLEHAAQRFCGQATKLFAWYVD